MSVPPPTHLSPAAVAYLRDPDLLEYPIDWADAWDVQAVREVAHPLWSSMNDAIDFPYRCEETSVGGVPCERISADVARAAPDADRASPDDSVIVHLHGGMYCLGSPEIDRVLNAPLARATGLTVFSVDYRLAPEHPFPGAVEDVVAVLRALADDGCRAIVVGESAGGGLAAAAALRAIELGVPAPQGLVLISPMLDLAGASDSFTTLRHVDPDYGHDPDILLAPGQVYAAGTPLDHPLISPVHADATALANLPSTLVHVGNREVLFGDAARFVRAAREAGAAATLHVLDGGWHNSPIWYGVPEADAAIADIAEFIRAATGTTG